MDPPLRSTLEGEVALVTGANRGIGQRIAANLLDLGATVYAGSRDPGAIEAHDGLVPLELDVTEDGEVDAALSRVDAESGRLDVLVNNAGVAPGPAGRPLLETPMADVDRAMAVNLRGPIALTRRALPMLLEREGSRVVNVSSGMGALGEGMSGGAPGYRISKAGLNALTVYLHGEYGTGSGLLASAVCPGWVRTALGGENADRSVDEGAETPTWLCRFAPGAPGGRFWRDRAVIEW